MDLGIKDRVALVAGASSGIGYGIAEALAAEGVRVVLCSRSADRITAAATQIEAATGTPTRGVAIDVLDPDCGTRFVAAATEAFGVPTIVVTNAGGSPPGPAAKYDVPDIERALQLNYLSAVRITRAALPGMQAARWGRIVHVTSTTVLEPKVSLFLSSASRPALVGYAKALAAEVAEQGITSNVLAPGLIGTERLSELIDYNAGQNQRSSEAERSALAQSVPARRLGTARELGDAAAFLCSERASYVTGVTLRVDGGRVSFIL